MPPLLNNDRGTITVASELPRIVLAVTAAFHHTGKAFGVFRKQTRCIDDQVRLFDMYYYIDPKSLLLVIFGKLCEPMAERLNHS